MAASGAAPRRRGRASVILGVVALVVAAGVLVRAGREGGAPGAAPPSGLAASPFTTAEAVPAGPAPPAPVAAAPHGVGAQAQAEPEPPSDPPPAAAPDPDPARQQAGRAWLVDALGETLPETTRAQDLERLADLLLEARDLRGRETPAREREILLTLSAEFERVAGAPMGDVVSRLPRAPFDLAPEPRIDRTPPQVQP